MITELDNKTAHRQPPVQERVVEKELQLLMPAEFPCIAHILKNPFPQDTTVLEFITRSQVKEWAKLLDITL